MASTNADSMTNAQGEFKPSRPRDEPLTTSGHQPGQQVGNDAAPEFGAKVLPPGSAPASKTFKPNPISEVPGQANNPDASATATGALDMPGSTSADVDTGIGKPASGETSQQLHHDGKSHRVRERDGLTGLVSGGSGLTGKESAHAQKLQQDHTPGPVSAREHNVSLDGAESKVPVDAEQVASMGQQPRQGDYDRTAEKAPGAHS